MTSPSFSKSKYMMPIVFGPMPGPRQAPPQGSGFSPGPTLATRYSVRYLTDRQQLEALVPPGLALAGEPVVSVDVTARLNVPWLAGRGYNIATVRYPVIFAGKHDTVRGNFLAVVWESLTEPILTGREQLGWPKIYADVATPQTKDGRVQCAAAWDGHRFLEMELGDLTPQPPETVARLISPEVVGDGMILQKYIPKTGEPWVDTDAHYFTLSPVPSIRNHERPPQDTFPKLWTGAGTVQFRRATWQQMPTQFHIVNTLADLKVREFLGATMMTWNDYAEYSDQRILR